MRVLVKEPGKEPVIKDIDGSLDSLQKEVGGYIEFVYIKSLRKEGIFVIVDDEGKIKNKDINIAMIDDKYNVRETLCGNIMFTGSKLTEDGPSCASLTGEQLRVVLEEVFQGSPKYTNEDGIIINSIRLD